MDRTLLFITYLIVLICIDLYVYNSLKSLFKRKLFKYVFLTLTSFGYGGIIYGVFVGYQQWSATIRVLLIGYFFISYIPKILSIIPLLISNAIDLFRYFFKNTTNQVSTDSRKKFLKQIAIGTIGVFGGSLLYGIIRGAYQLNIATTRLSFEHLPKSFHKFKIIQISDLHLGSFLNTHFLDKAIDTINSLQPDAVFFTGDLVNYQTDEAYAFENSLKKLKSKHGIFSVLGNHDYGDYVKWENNAQKKANFNDMVSFHKKLGWNLLLNNVGSITINNEKIDVLGVENWGAMARFPKYGNLKKTYQSSKNNFKILLSHDPSHWESEVLSYADISLTLSGHTHGMQFGIEIPGWLKWSPVQWIYKQWAGIYQKNNQYLYVNRGLGFIGYPGRVGISPEITLLELYSV